MVCRDPRLANLLCCRDRHDTRPDPFRVKLYKAAAFVLFVTWNCLGVHWAAQGDSPDPERRLPACSTAASGFHKAVRVTAICNLLLTTFLVVALVGFVRIFRLL